MDGRPWAPLGLVNVLVPPAFAILIITISDIAKSSIPVATVAAFTYPLGLVFLGVLPFAVNPEKSLSPKNYVDYARGARYGAILVAAATILVAQVWGAVFHQQSLGIALMLISFGSLWFPSASSSSAYGYLVLTRQMPDEFFARALRNPTSERSNVVFLIGVFLRNPAVLRRIGRTVAIQLIFVVLYFFGWILLGFAGGFPVTLFGLSLGVLVPLSSYVSLRRMLLPDQKRSLSELLLAKVS